ncbi:hypothetical protein [Lactococcus formosensis]|uniref:hypothetical protein n=1 Tax=Lactococcus formosensis TaxID=1281486 RepID=UPI003266331E
MSKPDEYLFRGSAFSSKQSAIEILVHRREQELRFHETWEKEAKPYFFNDNQPKLSIPKKIAEELEEYDIGEKGNYSLFSLSEEAREFYLTHSNIVTIYFASKALGVELVEVTDE